jgi:hypothetical protein
MLRDCERQPAMSACCSAETRPVTNGAAQRVGNSLCWLAPAAVLVLMPKCPLCLIAYVAAVSGIVLTVSASSFLQGFITIFCAGALTVLIWQKLRVRWGRG